MRTSALAMLLALAGALPAQAQGITGIFQTQPNDDGNLGMVEFYDCGGKYCGRLVKSFDKAGREIASPHAGKDIVAGMVDEGGGRFSGGTIWDPGADRTYKSRMQLDGRSLDVSGCVAVFCKTQHWTRVK